MARPTPRLHRLPQRLDYHLIPAPLDLSLPLATEKSPLPAIIVTPSSPSSAHDFSIAFLAPPPKPSICERLFKYAPSSFQAPIPRKAKTTIIIFVILFVLLCHLITHSMAARRPYLEFSVQPGSAHIIDSGLRNWFDFRSFWNDDHPTTGRETFVITEVDAP